MSDNSKTEMQHNSSGSGEPFRIFAPQCDSPSAESNSDVAPSTGNVVSTKSVETENRIEDRLLANEQPCVIKVGDVAELQGRVVDISPRGMGIVLDGENSINPDEKVELYFQQFLIIGFVANAVYFDDYVRIGISITERHRNMDRIKR